LLVRDLAPQRVRDADRARLVRVEQRAAVALAREDVVDQHAAVDEIDANAVGVKAWSTVPTGTPKGVPCGLPYAVSDALQIARVRDDRRHAGGGEGVAQQLELAVGRHLAPVDDGDLRRRGGAAPFAIAGDERVED